MLTFLARHLPLTPDQQSLLSPYPHPPNSPLAPVRLNTPKPEAAACDEAAATSDLHRKAAPLHSRAAPTGAAPAAKSGDARSLHEVEASAAAAGFQPGRQRLAATGVGQADRQLYEQLLGREAIFILETS